MEFNTIYIDAFKRGLEPTKQIDIDEWSEQNIVLSSVSSSSPGLYRLSITPYLREILKHLSCKSKFTKITVMKGAQLGFTNAACNFIGYYVDIAPSPSMYVLPSIQLAEKFSKTRLKPMFELSKSLKNKIKDSRERDSGNTILTKEFEGGFLTISGANSASSLCSLPIKNLILDEIDRMPDDVEGEGCPIELSTQRTNTFANKRIFLVSTPSLGSRSKINKSYLEGDQRKYFIPCPKCNEFQTLEFENLKWETGNYNSVKYECISCKYLIEEHNKTKMLLKGEWRATTKSKDPTHASYFISGLYSPAGWFKWSEAVRLFEESKNDINKFKSFMNTVLGLPYEETGEIIDWEKLYNRREKYNLNVVPRGGLFLTCGVDVQHDRLHCELVAWGRNKESWSIDSRILYGKVDQKEVWQELANIVSEEFEIEGSDLKMKIAKMGIDSSDGHTAFYVYSFCQNFKFTHVFPVQGRDKMTEYFNISPLKEFKKTGHKLLRGIKIYRVNVNAYKAELMDFLSKNRSDFDLLIGYCHFPDYHENFFKELTSEYEIKGKWVKQRNRNEALDCRVYARACASIFGIERFKEKDWIDLERKLEIKQTNNIAMESENMVIKTSLGDKRENIATNELNQSIQTKKRAVRKAHSWLSNSSRFSHW
jgi:phage terminase large subunit GpA-like protein